MKTFKNDWLKRYISSLLKLLQLETMSGLEIKRVGPNSVIPNKKTFLSVGEQADLRPYVYDFDEENPCSKGYSENLFLNRTFNTESHYCIWEKDHHSGLANVEVKAIAVTEDQRQLLFDMATELTCPLIARKKLALTRKNVCLSNKIRHAASGARGGEPPKFLKDLLYSLYPFQDQRRECLQVEVDLFNENGKIGSHTENATHLDNSLGLYFFIIKPLEADRTTNNWNRNFLEFKRKGRKPEGFSTFLQACATEDCVINLSGDFFRSSAVRVQLQNSLMLTVQFIHDRKCPSNAKILEKKRIQYHREECKLFELRLRAKNAKRIMKSTKLTFETCSTSSQCAACSTLKKTNNENYKCTTCYKLRSNEMCLPCGHMANCTNCLVDLRLKNYYKCVICQEPVQQVVRVTFPKTKEPVKEFYTGKCFVELCDFCSTPINHADLDNVVHFVRQEKKQSHSIETSCLACYSKFSNLSNYRVYPFVSEPRQ